MAEAKEQKKLTEDVEIFKDGTKRTVYRDAEGRVQMIKVEYPKKEEDEQIEDNGLLKTLADIQEMKVSGKEKDVSEKENASDKKSEKDKVKAPIISPLSRNGR